MDTTRSQDRDTAPWARRDTAIAILLALVALLIYSIHLGHPERHVWDEQYQVPTSVALANGDPSAYLWYTPVEFGGNEWNHPALGKLIMQQGIRVFGDNAIGWRAMSVLFGALGVALLFALGRLFVSRRVGLAAAVLLLVDGLWFVQSRLCMNYVFAAVFLMTGYGAFALYLGASRRRREALLASGAALGLAVATNWSGVFSLAALALFAAVVEIKRGALRSAGDAARTAAVLLSTFVIVPALVYLAGYLQFFHMGYSLGDFVALQRAMVHYETNLDFVNLWNSSWWTWPLMLHPIQYYAHLDRGMENLFAMGNPLIWWLFVPATAFALVIAVRERRATLALFSIGFLAQWLGWAASPRPTFIYHLLLGVPFGCLVVGWSVVRLARLPRLRPLTLLYPAAAVAAFVFFYPHYAARPLAFRDTIHRYWLSSWNPYKAQPPQGWRPSPPAAQGHASLALRK